MLNSSMFDPCPTSYDYNAPLTEARDPTDKYFAIKHVISRVRWRISLRTPCEIRWTIQYNKLL
jgi:hypothetical protein